MVQAETRGSKVRCPTFAHIRKVEAQKLTLMHVRHQANLQLPPYTLRRIWSRDNLGDSKYCPFDPPSSCQGSGSSFTQRRVASD